MNEKEIKFKLEERWQILILTDNKSPRTSVRFLQLFFSDWSDISNKTLKKKSLHFLSDYWASKSILILPSCLNGK